MNINRVVSRIIKEFENTNEKMAEIRAYYEKFVAKHIAKNFLFITKFRGISKDFKTVDVGLSSRFEADLISKNKKIETYILGELKKKGVCKIKYVVLSQNDKRL